ncbi:hypothetical protein E2C01_030513 [Portunus trituberculatus]|uniref:Uncharacterized protein n=1 Tax=Portunus trituberculatus TaxID=210409 RepID=A0A5B7EVI1_PORTR|nr:hypothetical protein [Portunus trituberculatus]
MRLLSSTKEWKARVENDGLGPVHPTVTITQRQRLASTIRNCLDCITLRVPPFRPAIRHARTHVRESMAVTFGGSRPKEGPGEWKSGRWTDPKLKQVFERVMRVSLTSKRKDGDDFRAR